MKAPSLVSILAAAVFVGGCNRMETDVRVEQVPKQPRPIMAQTSAGSIDWKVPQGWTQLPAQQMRLATFQVSAQNPSIVLTVIPLAGESGGVVANVNRWEGQLGLPSTPAGDLGKIVKKSEVAGVPMELVDLMGPESANPRQRLLGAILSHGGRTYYFKLAGPADVVSAQKANFDAFVQSIHFDGPGGHAPAAPAAPPAGGAMPPLPDGHPALPGAAQPPLPDGHPAIPGAPAGMGAAPAQAEVLTYTVPQGWVKDGPMPLRTLSFHIGEGEKKADVIVSRLPAVGSGSHAENITRWRNQVGLPPLAAGEQQLSTPLKISGIDANLFDFVGPGDAQRARRQLLAWVPSGQDWWFIKMIGPSDVVGQQQANFDAFLKSVKFAGQ